MKLQFRLSLALIALVVVGASQTWQSANLNDTGAAIEASGFSAFPQLGLLIAIQLLILFGSRYWSRWPAVVATLLAASLSLLATKSVLDTALNGSLNLISVKITAATGIADWTSQQDAIHNLQTNPFAIWLTLISSVLLVFLSLRGPFIRRAAKSSSTGEWVN